jgi:hypothetical protein
MDFGYRLNCFRNSEEILLVSSIGSGGDGKIDIVMFWITIQQETDVYFIEVLEHSFLCCISNHLSG